MIFFAVLIVLLQVCAALCDLLDDKPIWFLADLCITPIGVYRFFYLWVTK